MVSTEFRGGVEVVPLQPEGIPLIGEVRSGALVTAFQTQERIPVPGTREKFGEAALMGELIPRLEITDVADPRALTNHHLAVIGHAALTKANPTIGKPPDNALALTAFSSRVSQVLQAREAASGRRPV